MPPQVQRFLRDTGILRNIVDGVTRLTLAPAFFYESPHCFPEFIRIREHPYWLSLATNRIRHNLWNVTDPNAINGDASEMVEGRCKIRAKPPMSFRKEKYGSHPSQSADAMVQQQNTEEVNVPLLIFFHGGAWGSGFPTMYRLIASPFLEQNYRAVILGYRTYPDGTMDDQIQDLAHAIEYFTGKYAPPPYAAPTAPFRSE